MKMKTLNVILMVLVLAIPSITKDNPAQNRLMARRAAVVDAQRNLIEKIYGIQIDAYTRVEDFITRDDQVRGKLEGFINSAEIFEDSDPYKNGVYHVKIKIDMERLIKLIGKKFKYETRFIEAEGNGVSKDPSSKKKKNGKPKLLKAKGHGAIPKDKEISEGQKNLMAKRAAILDAYRNLIEEIKGVKVDAETTVQKFMLEDDMIMTQIENFVHGAKVKDIGIVEKGKFKDTYEVEIKIDLEELKKIIKEFGG